MMKTLTDEEKEAIERGGKAFMTPDQMSKVMQVTLAEILTQLKDESSEFHQAYFRGFFISEMEIRESVIALAKGGSSPAQQLAVKFWEDTKLELIK